MQNVLVEDANLPVSDLISLATDLRLEPVFTAWFEFASDEDSDGEEGGGGGENIPRPQFMVIQSGKNPVAVQEGVDLEMELDQVCLFVIGVVDQCYCCCFV